MSKIFYGTLIPNDGKGNLQMQEFHLKNTNKEQMIGMKNGSTYLKESLELGNKM